MTSATTRRARVDAVLAELRERFPAAFPSDLSTVRPLALGIREAIEALKIAGRTPVHRVLWLWTRTPAYLAAIAEGRPRVNLDGTDAGTVAAEHQAQAAERLASLRAKGERKAAAAAAAPVVPAAPVPEPAPEPASVAPTGRPVLTLKGCATVTKRTPK